jgi:hypothetical protein
MVLTFFAAAIVVGLSYEALAERKDSARYPPPGKLVDVGGYRLHLLCSGGHRLPRRCGTAALVPEWFDAQASPTKEQMTALYSRPNPGYAEALLAYETTPVSQRPYLAPGALGNRPVIALRHGKRSHGLSAEFEAGWLSSQDRLAQLSQAGVVYPKRESWSLPRARS